MPYGMALSLGLLWLIGIATSVMLGGLIHLLLIFALLGVVVQVSKPSSTLAAFPLQYQINHVRERS